VTDLSIASVEQRYRVAALRAAIVVMLGWHAATALPIAIEGWSRYRPPGTGTYVWVAFAVVGVIVARIVSRGGGQTPTLGLVVSALLLVGVALAVASTPTHSPVDTYSWAFASAGWFALVALWRRPVWELLAFLAANALTGLVVLAAAGGLGRVSVARFVVQSYGVSVLEVSVLVGGRALTRLARRTAEAQEAQARIANRQLAARAVHEARRRRVETVRQTAAELLAGLAADRLDLTDVATQQRLRVAVSRLRRLIVETDDVTDPLQHELRACSDAAEQRGVEVDLQAPVGSVPSLPVTVRRALTEPVIQVLAGARTRARITVVARADDVIVAVLADAPAATDRVSDDGDAEVTYDRQGDLLWAQTRWTAASPLPSSRTSTSSWKEYADGSPTIPATAR
jgi:hypothetical protein